MARRKKAEPNAKTDQETVGVTGDSTVQDAPKSDAVVVQPNVEGEGTHGTTQEGDTSPIKNTDKVPQNAVDSIETTPAPNDIAKEADENRTKDELAFANESNPNQKGRTTSAGGAEYDQDGNLRTDGYSYGVAPDDTRGVSDESFAENVGEAPAKADNKFEGKRIFTADAPQPTTVNTENTNVEVKQVDVQKLEDELSDPSNGISARVISSTGSYWRIKFFRDNKPFVTYKARTDKLNKREVKAFLNHALKNEA